jgi:hypothetical protein
MAHRLATLAVVVVGGFLASEPDALEGGQRLGLAPGLKGGALGGVRFAVLRFHSSNDTALIYQCQPSKRCSISIFDRRARNAVTFQTIWLAVPARRGHHRWVKAAPLLAVLVLGCGGVTPTYCRVKYLEKLIPRKDKYAICMERARLREARMQSNPQDLERPCTPQVVLPRQIVAESDGQRLPCSLRADGVYACSSDSGGGYVKGQ